MLPDGWTDGERCISLTFIFHEVATTLLNHSVNGQGSEGIYGIMDRNLQVSLSKMKHTKKIANRDFETIKVQRSCFIAFECVTALNPTYAWIEKVSHSVTICHVQYTLSANMH